MRVSVLALAEYRGTSAPSTGAKSPALASKAAASVPRISDDLPAMLGAWGESTARV